MGTSRSLRRRSSHSSETDDASPRSLVAPPKPGRLGTLNERCNGGLSHRRLIGARDFYSALPYCAALPEIEPLPAHLVVNCLLEIALRRVEKEQLIACPLVFKLVSLAQFCGESDRRSSQQGCDLGKFGRLHCRCRCESHGPSRDLRPPPQQRRARAQLLEVLRDLLQRRANLADAELSNGCAKASVGTERFQFR